MTLPPLLELSSAQKGSFICVLAFGAYVQGEHLVIPSACVKRAIKKGQILKYGTMRFKSLEALAVNNDPFEGFKLLIHKRGSYDKN